MIAALKLRTAAIRHSLTLRVTALMVRHNGYLRHGYLATIAERNRLEKELESVQNSFNGLNESFQRMHEIARKSAPVRFAAERFVATVVQAQSAQPNSVEIIVPDLELRASINVKLANLLNALKQIDPIPDPYFVGLVPSSPSQKVH